MSIALSRYDLRVECRTAASAHCAVWRESLPTLRAIVSALIAP